VAYQKQMWTDATFTTPVTAARLNNLESAVDSIVSGYNPTAWVDPTGGTAVTAGRLNHMEDGIAAADSGWVNAAAYGFVGDGIHDDTAAIQAALDTGGDVLIAGTATATAIARTTAPLRTNPNAPYQRVLTKRAHISPAFVGDAVQMTTAAFLTIDIRGDLQPTSGDYSNVAGIRIGSTANAWNPQHGSIANSNVQSFKGNAVIWEDGSMIDFTHFHADTIAGDGIRCTNANDNNHGWFANTHIVNATGKGYAIYGDGSNLNAGGSRHHVFQDAKAFGCGQNFYIESRSNVGTIFSELSQTPSTTTATSRGNSIQINETAASFEGWVDAGIGNEISGYSVNNAWETKELRVRTPTLGSTRFSSVVSGQYTIPSTAISNASFATFAPGVTGLGTGRVVNATLFSSVAGGMSLDSYVDASGNLQFQIVNNSGSSRTFTGVVSYVVWRFA
jgi:hypothetical protein